jgi:carbonic anhydrase
MTPAALARLKEGNARFAEGRARRAIFRRRSPRRLGDKHPFAAIVSCMDSRAPIEIVPDQAIGASSVCLRATSWTRISRQP